VTCTVLRDSLHNPRRSGPGSIPELVVRFRLAANPATAAVTMAHGWCDAREEEDRGPAGGCGIRRPHQHHGDDEGRRGHADSGRGRYSQNAPAGSSARGV
jgi:hypothetical protein